MVAAMILIDGEEPTLAWLEGIAANLRLQAEVGETAAANHFLSGGAGALVMPAGAAILATSGDTNAAEQFIRFLLSEQAQRFFVDQTFEFPMIEGIDPHPSLPTLESLSSPSIDLSDLAGVLDLATDLIAEAGLL